MASRRLRVEFIRFALLLTITAALISIAVRHDDNNGSRQQAARGHSPSASPSPTQGGSTSAPASQQPSSGATPSSSGASGDSGGNDGSAGSSDGATEGSGNGSTSSAAAGGAGDNGNVATLPRTGPTQAAALAALALFFIGAGYGGIRLSRRPGRQPLVASAAVTQPGQAAASSESNRPGTD